MKSKIAPGTSERLPRQILLFSLPLMASNVLQVLFNMADIAVIGRFAGSLSMAAVGSTATAVTLFTGILIGVGGGINALVARYYGARDQQELQRTVHSSAIICLICGILLLIFGFFGSRPLLRLLNGSEGIFVEPSAAISAAAYMGMMGESCTDYLKKHGLDEKMSRAAHILWATGGGLVPETERNELCGTGAKR
mgnify:CR=1 FL=1